MTNSISQGIQVTHQELTADARASLVGRWGLAVGTILIYMVVSGVSGLIPGVPLLIGGPFALGLAIFALRLARNQEVEMSNIFDGFQNFLGALGAYLLMMLMVLIGIILLIVPGIIVALGLSMTFFILADDPNKGAVDALKESWEMMKGNKMDYFIFILRFIPWIILCVFTLFIGMLWLVPYMQVSVANYYDALRYAQNGSIEDNIDSHLVEDL